MRCIDRVCGVLWTAVFALFASHPAAAQDTASAVVDSAHQLIVVRNVNLRPSPTTAGRVIRLLRPSDELRLREDTTTSGYYAVRTGDDEDGWVWARNVRPVSDAESSLSVIVPPAAMAAAGGAATSIDESWGKPEPNRSSFISHGDRCGAEGDGGDGETNFRKNRTDVPSFYHDVTFDAIATLAYPVGPKHRHDWSPAQLAEIQRYEGAAVRVAGYLVALKPQTGGSGESTNCHWNAASDVDWHIALVGKAGSGEEESVVVETTPRVRRKHSGWKAAKLDAWADSEAPVRISGWLMFDPEHRNHLGRYRATLWEIHPITKIEVWRNGRWEDLDALQ